MTTKERATIAIIAILALYTAYFMLILSNKCPLIPTVFKAFGIAGMVALAASLMLSIYNHTIGKLR